MSFIMLSTDFFFKLNVFLAKAVSASAQCRCGVAKQSTNNVGETKETKDTRIVGGSDVSPVSNE